MEACQNYPTLDLEGENLRLRSSHGYHNHVTSNVPCSDGDNRGKEIDLVGASGSSWDTTSYLSAGRICASTALCSERSSVSRGRPSPRAKCAPAAPAARASSSVLPSSSPDSSSSQAITLPSLHHSHA